MGNLTKNIFINLKNLILSENQTILIIFNETWGFYLGIIDVAYETPD